MKAQKALCLDLAQNWHGIMTGGGIIENIGLGYNAAIVKEWGYEIEMLQLPLNTIGYEEVITKAISFDLILVSCMIYNSQTSIDFADKIKKSSPQTQLIVGGAGPSGWPELFYQHFDAVIVGEGEPSLISFLRGQKGIINSGRNMNWNGHPWPIRNEEVLHKTRMCGISPIPYAEQIVAATSYSRGCPNNCWFCCSPKLWARKICWRHENDVVDEIEFLQSRYGVNMIDFCDTTFNANAKKVLSLCQKLNQQKNKVLLFAPCDLHGSYAEAKETFSAMKEAGFFKVAFGLEGSTSEERRNLNKFVNDIDDCIPSLQAASDAGLIVRAYLIIGTPAQNENHIASLKKSLLDWPIDELRVSIFCPFPGTQVWQDLQSLIVEKDLSKYDANWPIIKHPLWSNEQICNIRKDIMRHFYSSENYRSRKEKIINDNIAYQIGYDQLENYLRQAGFME